MGLTGDAGLYTSILILLAISGFFCIAGGLSGQFLFYVHTVSFDWFEKLNT